MTETPAKPAADSDLLFLGDLVIRRELLQFARWSPATTRPDGTELPAELFVVTGASEIGVRLQGPAAYKAWMALGELAAAR